MNQMITQSFRQMTTNPWLRGRDPKQVHPFKVLLLRGNHHPKSLSGDLLQSSLHDVPRINPLNNTKDEIPSPPRPQLRPWLLRLPLQLPLPTCRIRNEPLQLVFLPKSSNLSILRGPNL